MKHWINTHYKSLIIAAFLIPIMTVAVVSISHVTKWYGISNPISWAIYLSIGIEIAALSALAAISADMGKKVYFPFAIVTLIQFIGNIFFAYSFIDINAQSFKDWVDLVSPLVSFMGIEPTDFVGHKRFLAFFAGGMLPIISLSFLHMLVKFTEEDRKKEEFVVEEEQKHVIDDKLIQEAIEKYKQEQDLNKIEASDLVSEISRVRLTEEDLKILEKHILNPEPPNAALVSAKSYYQEKVKETNERKNTPLDQPLYDDETIVNDSPISKEETTFVFKNRSQVLSEMTQDNQDMGLYDEPFDNPLIKEKPADWEPTISDNFTIGPDGAYEREEEENYTIEPTEEEENENFSTIESNMENIFQDNFIENEIVEEISQNVKQDEDYAGQFEDWGIETVPEPFATEDELTPPVDVVIDNEPEILELLTEFQTENFSEEPTKLDESPNVVTEGEKKNNN